MTKLIESGLMGITLAKLPTNFRYLIALFLLTLTLGVGLGLAYVFSSTRFSVQGIEKTYGSEKAVVSTSQNDDLELNGQQYYAKTAKELLMTTHNHVLSLSVIFFLVSLLAYFTESTSSMLKKIIIFEPFMSIWLTFGGMWGVRFIDPVFKYLILFSSFLLYSVFFITIVILFYELILLPVHRKN